MKNSIRISGGNLKGKKIPFDFKDTLRPTSNKLKEIIFNWLQFEIQDLICLDLFAGTGSLGIEALSRNCSRVVFVELNKKNYSVLSQNVIDLDLKNKSKIYFKDAFEWVKKNDLSMSSFESVLSLSSCKEISVILSSVVINSDKPECPSDLCIQMSDSSSVLSAVDQPSCSLLVNSKQDSVAQVCSKSIQNATSSH